VYDLLRDEVVGNSRPKYGANYATAIIRAGVEHQILALQDAWIRSALLVIVSRHPALNRA
jgi:hypothetical protein